MYIKGVPPNIAHRQGTQRIDNGRLEPNFLIDSPESAKIYSVSNACWVALKRKLSAKIECFPDEI